MEERLRDDVINEVHAFGGRWVVRTDGLLFMLNILSPSLLLHTETPDGSVIPIWEEVNSEDIMVLKDVMAQRRHIGDHLELGYARIPITAERPPDFTDLSELIEVMIRSNAMGAPVVINCQLGRGRSTLTSVILLLIQQWLASATRVRDPTTPGPLQRSMTNDLITHHHNNRQSYQIINSECV